MPPKVPPWKYLWFKPEENQPQYENTDHNDDTTGSEEDSHNPGNNDGSSSDHNYEVPVEGIPNHEMSDDDNGQAAAPLEQHRPMGYGSPGIGVGAVALMADGARAIEFAPGCFVGPAINQEEIPEMIVKRNTARKGERVRDFRRLKYGNRADNVVPVKNADDQEDKQDEDAESLGLSQETESVPSSGELYEPASSELFELSSEFTLSESSQVGLISSQSGSSQTEAIEIVAEVQRKSDATDPGDRVDGVVIPGESDQDSGLQQLISRGLDLLDDNSRDRNADE